MVIENRKRIPPQENSFKLEKGFLCMKTSFCYFPLAYSQLFRVHCVSFPGAGYSEPSHHASQSYYTCLAHFKREPPTNSLFANFIAFLPSGVSFSPSGVSYSPASTFANLLQSSMQFKVSFQSLAVQLKSKTH